MCDLSRPSHPLPPDLHTDRTVWTLKNTNQYNDWQQARVPIPPTSRDYYVKLVGQYGPDVTSPVGGVGVDDVTFTDLACACEFLPMTLDYNILRELCDI